jgi:iron complex outermembrane receptor protein
LLYNPSFAGGCAPPYSLPSTGAFTPGNACGFDVAAYAMAVPEVERGSVYGRATVQASPDHQLFAELAWSANRTTVYRDPTDVAPFTNPAFSVIRYPAGGPFYPTAFAEANGLSGDLELIFNTAPLGARQSRVDTSAWRAVLGAEGALMGWDYGTSLGYSRNHQDDRYQRGFVSLSRLRAAFATGLVNPFGPSGPEGDALLAASQISTDAHSATGTTVEAQFKASRETIALPGGALAIAFGAEARRERLSNEYSDAVTSGDVSGIDVAVQSVSGSRSVQALFVEASAPFVKGVEAQLAARYDHYSDFGSTVNPKVALRWQPMSTLLMRTSWGRGFRAPPLYDLHTPQERTTIFAEDPVRCPVTQVPEDCDFLPAVVGGNPALDPETSEQFNVGVVWEPVRGLSIAVDYWKINKYKIIGSLAPDSIFADYDRWAPTNIVRGPVDPNYPNLPGPITAVVLTQQNLGNLKTSGFDVDVAWRGPSTSIGRFSLALNGTYIREWKFQPEGSAYESGVGRNALGVPGPFPRWKHYASLDWQYGGFGATLAQTFQSGYEDTNFFPERVTDPPPPRRVSSYDVWDLQGRYTGWRNAMVALGVRNLLDRDPPFTNQPFTTQVGYDPSYADPRGRTIYARLSYTFR